MERVLRLSGAMSALALILGLGLSAPAHADMDATWSTFDSDGNGMLSESEFGDGLFNTWDADNDSRISNGEFGDHDLFGDTEFSEYDANGDGYWDETEYDTAYGQSGIYDRYENAEAQGIRPEEFATFYDDAGDAGLFDV